MKDILIRDRVLGDVFILQPGDQYLVGIAGAKVQTVGLLGPPTPLPAIGLFHLRLITGHWLVVELC